MCYWKMKRGVTIFKTFLLVAQSFFIAVFLLREIKYFPFYSTYEVVKH